MFWLEVIKYAAPIFSSILIGVSVWWIRDRIKLYNVKKFFYYTLYQLREATESQIKLFNEFIDGLKSNELSLPGIKTAYGFNVNSVKIVSLQDLFRIFVLQAKKKFDGFKEFVFLMDCLEVIKNTAEKSELDYYKFNEEYNGYIEEYNKVFVKIRSIIHENDYLKVEELSNLMKFFIVPEPYKYTLSETLEKFVNPLIEIAKKHELMALWEILPDAQYFIMIANKHRSNGIEKFENDLKNLEKSFMFLDQLIKKNKKLFEKDLNIEIK